MNIITYRGPGMAGGLSNAVGQAWHVCSDLKDYWWNLSKTHLQRLSAGSDEGQDIAAIPQELIDGHYQYCNEFLWPVLHNLPGHAVLALQANRQYEQFNLAIAQALSNSFKADGMSKPTCFIHDYHFALLPYFLKRQSNARSVFFWHVPWPKMIEDQSVNSQLKNIVTGLLYCEAIGFHTSEYAVNFLQFVHNNLPEFKCDMKTMSISHLRNLDRKTQVMVAPLGIDFESWQSLAQEKLDQGSKSQFGELPYIFSVDRADYTKGVTKRLEAVDYFFERFPRWREKITFVQSCGRTRVGLSSFDQYWQDCHQLQERILQTWSTNDWQPVVWLKDSIPTTDLAQLYAGADVMLVNPVRDGLNLTAKEYVACQSSDPGVLLLSKGAGVWDELGNYSIDVDPLNPKSMAESINRALCLAPGEKALRMSLLRAAVQRNSLIAWWYRFKNKLDQLPKANNGILIEESLLAAAASR